MLPDFALDVWAAFTEMSDVNYIEIQCRQQLTGLILDPWEVDCLFALDRVRKDRGCWG